MEAYFVDGLFLNRQAVRKARKTGKAPAGGVEPFARTLWANSPQEALQMATEALDGGEWLEAPRVSQVTEEQRMRRLGAPQLPGFSTPPPKRRPTTLRKPKV